MQFNLGFTWAWALFSICQYAIFYYLFTYSFSRTSKCSVNVWMNWKMVRWYNSRPMKKSDGAYYSVISSGICKIAILAIQIHLTRHESSNPSQKWNRLVVCGTVRCELSHCIAYLFIRFLWNVLSVAWWKQWLPMKTVLVSWALNEGQRTRDWSALEFQLGTVH